jgi:CRISPR/Cas system Type II protein with McrA/HNH and RuvC-like nuclease domain
MNNKYRKTLVLDSGYIPRSVISSERAFVISYKGNAEIVEEHPESFKLVNPNLDIPKPSIIRVYKYINVPFQKVALTRENIYKRDNYECVYCGQSDKRTLTLDHVIPKSKGGKDVWENLVTACKKCNLEKADLTLEEYGKTIPKPFRPHYLMLLKKVDYLPDGWRKYFF